MTCTTWSVFDVDRTITRRPTYSLFLLFAMRRLAPWRVLLLPLLVPVSLAYWIGAIPRRTMKETMHRIAIGGSISSARIRPVADEFARRLFERGLYPQAVVRMEQERMEGRRVILATAAPALYIEPLARHLGIEDIEATAGDWQGETLGHRIVGDNCYGEEKLNRIRALQENSGIARERVHVRFFTDHASDRFVCDWVDESLAVNPSSKMAALARDRGWQVLEWRGR